MATPSGPADELASYFLGAFGENNDLLEGVLVELLRDHVYWRRNFHPDDTPPISTAAQFDEGYQQRVANMKRELHRLAAQLKRSVPTFHPRYIGHMTSDLLLPGLIGQLVTTLYNPNNIVDEVAPVTLALEHEVGQQLCRMVGYATNTQAVPCGAGHLTSGGTLANDEALFLARATRFAPLAVRDACEATGAWVEPALRDADDVELLGWPTARALDLVHRVLRRPDLSSAFAAARVEARGLVSFAASHPAAGRCVVVAPASAHYSWAKAMRLLGLGEHQLVLVPTCEGRMEVDGLETTLRELETSRTPVLAVIGVYGTTEFGSFDELHRIAGLRRADRSFWLHVDAAGGGYLPSVFRETDGSLRPREQVSAGFRHFPSERVYRSTAALAEADSVTVDPHKLGYVPYGAGAFLCRDRRAFELAMQQAAYVFTSTGDDEARFRNAARFSLEGSRPGAAAAAVALNHRVLPLDHAHYGQLLSRSVRACESLYDQVPGLRARLEGLASVAVPFEPDCNVVGLAFNPQGNRSLAVANAFTRRLFDALAVRPADQSGGDAAFFGSCTTVPLAHLGTAERARLSKMLGVEFESADASGLFMLRHTLMNPWLLSSPDDSARTWIDAYVSHLEGVVRALRA
ncbi:MAG: pyridoxal-dependent decarboxylase [Archangiaceae bacterium]|nr:pyridoxal-dependent decarboxylase [Archangiaceae bacterium]